MSFITTYNGEVLLLRYILNNITPGNVQLHLFNNDITPNYGDVISMYTESSAAGYSAFALNGGSWTFATSAGTSTATYAQQTFTFTTSETLYGYYLTNTDVGNVQTLVHVERFSGAPFQLPSGGGTIAINPQIGLK